MSDTNWVGVTPDPPRYTLEEASRELNKRTCAQDGHDFVHIVNGMGDLIRIDCGRCGRTWATVER